MAHQEGYEDRWEQGTGSRIDGPAMGSEKRKTVRKHKKMKETKQQEMNGAWGNDMTNKTLDTVHIYLQNTGGILPTE